MRSLNELTNRNDRATMREYNDAVEAGNVTLAGRIALANPDLFPGRTPTMRVQSQREQPRPIPFVAGDRGREPADAWDGYSHGQKGAK